MNMIVTPAFTVVTATYNRRHTLQSAYDGLCKQSFRDFEWIIIDDGSTDGTRDLVLGWNPPFPIRYEYQSNQGRPSAVNAGLELARGKYIVALDSDDVPTPDALNCFYEVLANAPEDIGVAGCLTMTPDGTIIGSAFDSATVDMTMLEAYSHRAVTGDKWLAFRAEIAKRFLFPTFGGEKHVPEALVFNRISRAGYRTRFINRPLLVHEYFSDGITKGTRAFKRRNPVGFLAYYSETVIERDCELSWYYLKHAANIPGLLLLASRRPFVVALLLLLGLPIGILKGALDRLRADSQRAMPAKAKPS